MSMFKNYQAHKANVQITKLSDEDQTVRISTKQFSSQTGEEIDPVIETKTAEDIQKELDFHQSRINDLTVALADINAALGEPEPEVVDK